MSGNHNTPDTTNRSHPRLRFPEFQNDDGWKKMTLGDAATFYNGRAYKQEELLESGKYPVLRVGNFFTSNTWYYSDLELDETKYCDSGDLLYAWSASFGPRIWHGDKTIYHYHIWKVVEQHGIDKRFLFTVLENETERMKAKTTNGLGIMHITKGAIESWEATIPAIEEQRRIAECLSSVDEVIAAQARKVEALKTHKKGLMQQLFPREGETQPRLRFSDDGDWAVARLPEVVFFQEGPGIMAADFRSEGVPLVRLAGVGGTSVSLDGCNFLDPEKVTLKWDHFRLALNDLIISTSATFGLSSIVTEAAAGAVFYTGLIRFRPSSDRIDLGYLQVYLGSPHFARQADAAAVGGGIKHFGPTHLKQMEIAIPPLTEQQRIASCMSSLDTVITAETQKLETYTRHKRGLMQQLFPLADEA